jgi:hypothetical protein
LEPSWLVEGIPLKTSHQKMSGGKRKREDDLEFNKENIRFTQESLELFSKICMDTNMDDQGRQFFKATTISKLKLNEVPCIRNIQRWFRNVQAQRRTLAIMMALHVRLGNASGLQYLGEDLLKLCLRA